MTFDIALALTVLTASALIAYTIMEVLPRRSRVSWSSVFGTTEHAPLVWVGHRTVTLSCECGEYVEVVTRNDEFTDKPKPDKQLWSELDLRWRCSPCAKESATRHPLNETVYTKIKHAMDLK